LTNGTAYTFTVTATNAVGTSAPSAASNSATPYTVPNAPTIGTATATGTTTASITFTAPVNNGGSTITSYTMVASPGGSTGSGGSSPITVSGLTQGTDYSFTCYATNAAGNSSSSSSSNTITTSSEGWYSRYTTWANGQMASAMVAADTSGNIYITPDIIGTSTAITDKGPGLLKIDQSGSLQYGYFVNQSTDATWSMNGSGNSYQSIATDSSNNVYLGVRLVTGSNGVGIAKYNSSGSLQWASTYTTNTSNASVCTYKGGSGDAYFISWTTSAVGIYALNSSGTLQWGNLQNSGDIKGPAMGVAGSSNIYVCGTYSSTANFGISKFTSGGTYSLFSTISGSGGGEVHSTAMYGNESAMHMGIITNSYTYAEFYAFDTSLNFTWGSSCTTVASGASGGAAAYDSNGNLFVAFRSSSTGYVFKYNSSGTLQWQRSFGAVGDRMALGVDSNNNVIVSILTSTKLSVFRYPNNGSITGTFTVDSFSTTIATSSLGFSGGSYSTSSGTPSISSSTPTLRSATYTSNGATNTYSTTTIS
jgi:hypothetical protein